MHDPFYLTYIFHNNRLVKFSKEEENIDRSYTELAFREISQYLEMSDSLFLTFPRAFSIEETTPLIDYINTSKVKTVYFFVEDVLTVSCSEELDHLDLTIIDRYPKEFKIREFEIIRKILEHTNIKNTVFHCEHNLGVIVDRYQDLNIHYFDIFLSITLAGVYASNHNIQISSEFEYKICCFNHRSEPYRTVISCLLYNTSEILITLGKALCINELRFNRTLPLSKFTPFIQDSIIKNLDKILKKGGKLTWDIDATSNYTMLSMAEQWNTVHAINNSFCVLVTETRYATTILNFSEKTLKPMLMKKPFLLLGPPKTLKFLKDLGFKTFDQWWDESYDCISNHNLRLEAIYDLIQSILRKSDNELKDILEEMQEVLTYNQEHLKSLTERMLSISSL